MTHRLFMWLLSLLLARIAICSKLITTDVTENAKMACQNVKGTVYTVKSEMQCHHRCLRKEKCEILNYKTSNAEDRSEKDNCEVFDVSSCNHICSKTTSNGNWKTVVLMREEKAKVYESCKEIYEDKPDSTTSGVYDLRSGKHYCVMTSLSRCGGGGWTLAMKTDGTKKTFNSDSKFWQANNVYNVEMGLKSFESEEAKFASFNSLSFTKICLGMKSSGVTSWIGITKTESSLLEIFKRGQYQPTNLGRSTWQSLISQAYLQPKCNREGFNVDDDSIHLRLRIGIMGNNENDCNTPDSFIGFGTNRGKTCGTFTKSRMGYILIQ